MADNYCKPLPTLTVIQSNRFWSKVEIRGLEECWEWTAAKRPSGYGVWGTNNTSQFMSHRLAYADWNRVDPGQLYVCHRCDNPSCCNPNHLFLGTCKDNSDDKVAKNRHPHGDTHFIHNHPEVVRGERNPASKITELDVREIRKLHAQGKSQTYISRLYPISQPMIGRIINKKSWPHVGQ